SSHELSFQQVKLGILAEVKIAQKRGNRKSGNGRINPMGIVKINTTVLPGRRIELTSPELTEGQAVEVLVRPQRAVPSGAAATDPVQLLKLPLEERRRILEAAAEEAVEYYSQPDPERDAWQGGDIVEY